MNKYFKAKVTFSIYIEKSLVDDNLIIQKDTYKCVRQALKSIGNLLEDSYLNYKTSVVEAVLKELVSFYNQKPKPGSYYYDTLVEFLPHN